MLFSQRVEEIKLEGFCLTYLRAEVFFRLWCNSLYVNSLC